MGSLKRQMKAEKIPGQPSTGRGTIAAPIRHLRRPMSPILVGLLDGPRTPDDTDRAVAYLRSRAAALGIEFDFAALERRLRDDPAPESDPCGTS